jgi:predicted Ser/Thr protein kinase
MQESKKEEKDIFALIDSKLKKEELGTLIPFKEFLNRAGEQPQLVFRNVFQLFNNMFHNYITVEDEYKNDPENIHHKTINCDKLLVENTDTPFFADLLLANRLMRLADSFEAGSQQNKIYIFIGPAGSGKSTFLNNILLKLQEYTKLPEGAMYEVMWQLDEQTMGSQFSGVMTAALEEYFSKHKTVQLNSSKPVFNIPCPSHDHPILIIPREFRREILENVIPDEHKQKIFNNKEYEWIFKDDPCTICQSIYQSLINRSNSPAEVFNMVFAKRYYFNRRLGNGISIFNPGDREPEKFVLTNEVIQHDLELRFRDSNLIKYVFSRYAKTNNGVFAIMDVKGYNEKRFIDLHGIISEGIHKIEDVEENVNSLFIAVMNPEDKSKVNVHESFRDRIIEINVNYNLNYKEEVKIYFHMFGNQILNRFLPKVLNNFAKIIISSRLNSSSAALKEWIKDPDKYEKYCDESLLLLKLGIYNNKIPKWLSQEDYNNFSKSLRRRLIDESESEGRYGFSGRESISIFNEFYNSARKKYRNGASKTLITMDDVKEFFFKNRIYSDRIPRGFIDSIIRLYDYDLIQQIKESMFHENEERIAKDIQNYLFASNYDLGQKLICPYTNELVEISDPFYNIVEQHLFMKNVDPEEKKKFRAEIAAKFVISLQEMQAEGDDITHSQIFKDLHSLYIKNLRESIIQPFLQYSSFENAIKEYRTPKFDVFDARTKGDVDFLIKKLMSKFHYTLDGARQVCLYVIHNHVAEKFIS